MAIKTITNVNTKRIDSNLFRKPVPRTFFNKLNILLGFKERSKKSLIIITIFSLVLLSGLAGFILFFNGQGDEAKASSVQSDLLDSSFGESGQIPLIEQENNTFTNIKFLEYQGQLFAAATAVDKDNSTLKSLAVFALKNDGSLDTNFNTKGFNIVKYPNAAAVEVVDFIISSEAIFILSKIDGCGLKNETQCGASDVLVTKFSLDGQKIDNYGKDGLASFNLSENLEVSKLGERQDYPVSIIGFNSGRVAFLSSYQYQDKETFNTGFQVMYLNNKGLIDKDQGIEGVQKFNHKNYTVLANDSEYELLRPMSFTATARNSARIGFTKGNNIYGEIILDAFGKIKPTNNLDINFITADTKLFGDKDVRLNARRLINGKILFYGSCNLNPQNQWQSICLTRYLDSNQIDTTFAVNNNNVFTLEYIGEDFVFEYGVNYFLEDPVTQQIALSVAVRTDKNTRTINEIILLKPTGEFNTNFANKGIWRTASSLVAKAFLVDGKVLAVDNSKIYRLVKPLFIDPVITKISPASSSTVGGLSVTIEGDNFFSNPDNPKFTEAQGLIKTISQKSSISNYLTVSDKQNVSYIVGTFSGELNLKDKNYQTQTAKTNIFIARVNTNQEIIWANVVGGLNGDDGVLNIAVDAAENLYILGSTTSDLSLFNGNANGESGKPNLFVAKYTKNGQVGWVKRINGELSSIYTSLVVTSDTVYVGGNFNASITVDTNQLTTRESQGFILSLNSSNANLNWLQSISSVNQTQLKKISLTQAGEIMVFGDTNGSINIGFVELKSLGSKDIFVLKYNKLGKIVSAKILGGKGIDEIEDVIITSQDEIILTADFSASPLSNIENNGGFFVVKLNLKLDLLWATEGRGLIKQDLNQDSIIYGVYQDTIKLGATVLKSKGESDAFIAKIDTNGKVLWAYSWGGAELDNISDVYVDKDDNIYVAGTFKTTANFNNILLTALGDLDLYILKFNATGGQIWLKQAGSKNQDLNLKFSGDLDRGTLNFLALVGGSSNFDKLSVPADINDTNLVIGSFYDQELSVYFGDKLATKMEIINKNKLIVTTPSQSAGIVDVRVVGYDGSEIIFPNSFEYSTSVNLNLDTNPNNGSGASRI